MVLSAHAACEHKLGKNVKQLKHDDDAVERGEHLDRCRETALGRDVGEQTRDMHRNERNDHAAQHAGNDVLKITENLEHGIALEVRHADAENERQHERGHDTENRGDLNREERLESVALKNVARDGFDERGEKSLADKEGKEARDGRRAVGQQQRQAEQTVRLLTQLRHADRDEGNDDQRNHEGQESGKQRGERREQSNDRNKSRRVRNAEPASAKADQHTGDDADNESNQQSKLFQCYILLFFIFSLSRDNKYYIRYYHTSQAVRAGICKITAKL